MSSRCDLHLENYARHYVPGQTIVGFVQCTFVEEKTVNGITVEFDGKATTHWSENESHYNAATKKNESRTVYYNATETYFRIVIDVLKQAGRSVVIPKGVHNYPFTYTLPTQLPSSFVGDVGRVVYTAKAEVDRPFLKKNYEAEANIKIFNSIDLNVLGGGLQEPFAASKEKKLWFSCTSGPIKLELNVPFTGFACGQRIPIYLYIENMSNSSIEKTSYEVVKHIEFHSHTPKRHTRHQSERVYKKHFPGVGAHSERIYDEGLVIPENTDTPDLRHCSIINVTYELIVQAYLPCPHRNLKTKVPVTLGNIPLTATTTIVPNAFVPPPAYNPEATFYTPTQTPAIPPLPAVPVATAPTLMPQMPPLPQFTHKSQLQKPSASQDDSDWVDIGAASEYADPTAPPSYDQAVGGYGFRKP